jgi:hypothetical protein
LARLAGGADQKWRGLHAWRVWREVLMQKWRGLHMVRLAGGATVAAATGVDGPVKSSSRS